MKNLFIIALFALVAIVLPEMSYAIDGQLKNALCAVVNASHGSVAKGLATLAVVFVGIGAFFGKANWGLVIITAVGIGMLFGAENIAQAISSSNSANC